MKKQIALYSVLSLSLVGCSNLEPIDQKMSRYKTRDIQPNQVPELVPFQFNYTRATTATDKNSNTEMIEVTEKDMTNKKLYFQNLYQQYLDLNTYVSVEKFPVLEMCPQFHSAFLEFKKKGQKDAAVNFIFSYDVAKLSDTTYLASNPELMLPMTTEEMLPRVVDYLKSRPNITASEQSETVKKALQNHLGKTYAEVKELCEYGVSQNYYAFENLMTYAKTDTIAPGTDGMKILLKTTIFSNEAIKTSLTKFTRPTGGRFPASTTTAPSFKSNEVAKRLNVPWVRDYYQAMKN